MNAEDDTPEDDIADDLPGEAHDGTVTRRLHLRDDQAGDRLDKVLAGLLPDVSRSRLQALISRGRETSGNSPASTLSSRSPA